MPKNRKIKNLFHMILDFSGQMLLTKFEVNNEASGGH